MGNQAIVLDLIRQHPGIRPRQLRELTGAPKRTIGWCLRELRRKKAVEARGDLRDARRRCYYAVAEAVPDA